MAAIQIARDRLYTLQKEHHGCVLLQKDVHDYAAKPTTQKQPNRHLRLRMVECLEKCAGVSQQFHLDIEGAQVEAFLEDSNVAISLPNRKKDVNGLLDSFDEVLKQCYYRIFNNERQELENFIG